MGLSLGGLDLKTRDGRSLDSEVALLMAEFDTNKDGAVSRDEFRESLQRHASLECLSPLPPPPPPPPRPSLPPISFGSCLLIHVTVLFKQGPSHSIRETAVVSIRCGMQLLALAVMGAYEVHAG